MNEQDSLPKNQSGDQTRNNNRKVRRAISVGLPPCLDLLRSRCDNAEVSGTPYDRRLVRSQSESKFSLQAWRNSSWTTNLKNSQELHCSSGEEAKEWKLPSIPQRNEATASQPVDDFEELPTMTSTMLRRHSLCVLPHFSKGPPRRAFRAAAPLRKQQVEEANNDSDSLKIKSHNLAKWLRDQQ